VRAVRRDREDTAVERFDCCQGLPQAGGGQCHFHLDKAEWLASVNAEQVRRAGSPLRQGPADAVLLTRHGELFLMNSMIRK